MDAQNDNTPLEARPATPEDFIGLCRRFNEAGVRYVVIGGMAMIQHGLLRLTNDIDVLVDVGADNVRRIREAMSTLPDHAAAELADDDIQTYGVVRVADEFMTDLMKTACGIGYEEAVKDVVHMTIDNVSIPFASPQTLWLTKRTYREKDVLDRNFLAELLRQRGESLPSVE